MAVAACRFAIVHNLHEVPPVPSHLSRQDNHSLHKWAASTWSAGQPEVGGRASAVGSSQHAGAEPEPVAELEVTRSDPGVRWGLRARAVDTIPRLRIKGSAPGSTGKYCILLTSLETHPRGRRSNQSLCGL